MCPALFFEQQPAGNAPSFANSGHGRNAANCCTRMQGGLGRRADEPKASSAGRLHVAKNGGLRFAHPPYATARFGLMPDSHEQTSPCDAPTMPKVSTCESGIGTDVQICSMAMLTT